jgi:PAS domain S-box-containing protein
MANEGNPAEPGELNVGERRVLDLVTSGAALSVTLDTICDMIDVATGLVSSIFLLDSAGDRLTFAAGPHVPTPWRTAVEHFPITQGACGAAIAARQRVISENMQTDALYREFRKAALDAGFRSAFSTPFFDAHQQPVGTFAVMSSSPGRPREHDLRCVDRAAKLAGLAVEHARNDRSLSESERRFSTAFYASPAAMSILRFSDRRFLYVNDAQLAVLAYSRDEVVGQTPEALKLELNIDRDAFIKRVREEGHIGEFQFTLRNRHGDERELVASMDRVEILGEDCLLSAAIDVTERRRTEAALRAGHEAAAREVARALAHTRALAARLLRAQDDERRRIAQQLHETTAQDLAALKMLLGRLLQSANLDATHRSIVDESVSLADRSMSEIRTLSYLLHPPFLDESGLLLAVRWYSEGFAKRSGIAVDLDLPAEFPRLSRDDETAIFRVLQESLLNVHHHSQSRTASVHLGAEGERLILQVADRGRGIPREVLSRLMTSGGGVGVGVAGMRERLEQLGGTLAITSGDQGTTVSAELPLRVESEHAAANSDR